MRGMIEALERLRFKGSEWIGGFGWLGFGSGVRGVLGLSCWRAGGALGANLHVGKFGLSVLLFRHLERCGNVYTIAGGVLPYFLFYLIPLSCYYYSIIFILP